MLIEQSGNYFWLRIVGSVSFSSGLSQAIVECAFLESFLELSSKNNFPHLGEYFFSLAVSEPGLGGLLAGKSAAKLLQRSYICPQQIRCYDNSRQPNLSDPLELT